MAHVLTMARKKNMGCIQANSNPQVVINKVGSVFVGIYYTTTPLLEFQIAMEWKINHESMCMVDLVEMVTFQSKL
jgi:hypothetical protein